MSYLIDPYNNPYNNQYTMENSQKSHFEDKLHLPVFQFDNKDEKLEHTIINIIGYVDSTEQDTPDNFSPGTKSTGHVLPLTIQDLNQYSACKDNIPITNFIENLISTNQSSKISYVIFSSIKSIGGFFKQEEKKSDVNVINFDYPDYCDAV